MIIEKEDHVTSRERERERENILEDLTIHFEKRRINDGNGNLMLGKKQSSHDLLDRPTTGF